MQNEVPSYLKLDTNFDFVARGLVSKASNFKINNDDAAVSDDTDDLMQENAI